MNKYYILRTNIGEENKTRLNAYIYEPYKHACAYITTSLKSAWKFKSKKEAKRIANFYGGCVIDCYWR